VIVLRRIVTAVLFVGVLVFGWRFAHENSASVTVSYLAGQYEGVALWLLVLVSFGMGVALTSIFALFGRARAGLIARRYRKTVAALEAEVHQLRNLPLVAESAGGAPVESDRDEGA